MVISMDLLARHVARFTAVLASLSLASANAEARTYPASPPSSERVAKDASEFRIQQLKPIGTEAFAILQAITGTGVCTQYTYDKNGNITAISSASHSTAPTWGSSAFGCFAWHTP